MKFSTILFQIYLHWSSVSALKYSIQGGPLLQVRAYEELPPLIIRDDGNTLAKRTNPRSGQSTPGPRQAPGFVRTVPVHGNQSPAGSSSSGSFHSATSGGRSASSGGSSSKRKSSSSGTSSGSSVSSGWSSDDASSGRPPKAQMKVRMQGGGGGADGGEIGNSRNGEFSYASAAPREKKKLARITGDHTVGWGNVGPEGTARIRGKAQDMVYQVDATQGGNARLVHGVDGQYGNMAFPAGTKTAARIPNPNGGQVDAFLHVQGPASGALSGMRQPGAQ